MDKSIVGASLAWRVFFTSRGVPLVTISCNRSLLIKTPNRAVKIAAEAEMKKDDDDHEILEIITARHHKPTNLVATLHNHHLAEQTTLNTQQE